MTTTMLASRSPREHELRGRDTERLELPMPPERSTLYSRFITKVVIPEDSTECWTWIGATVGRDAGHKYGRLFNGNRTAKGHAIAVPAHRIAYELFVGPIPDGLEIDHLCRNTLCVNPDHLEPVTRLENQRRGFSPMQAQRKQTHCKRGHPLDEVNTYVWKGMRRCRECNRVQVAEYRKRRREC